MGEVRRLLEKWASKNVEISDTASVTSKFTVREGDSRTDWRLLRRQLLDAGLTGKQVDRHRSDIVRYLIDRVTEDTQHEPSSPKSKRPSVSTVEKQRQADADMKEENAMQPLHVSEQKQSTKHKTRISIKSKRPAVGEKLFGEASLGICGGRSKGRGSPSGPNMATNEDEMVTQPYSASSKLASLRPTMFKVLPTLELVPAGTDRLLYQMATGTCTGELSAPAMPSIQENTLHLLIEKLSKLKLTNAVAMRIHWSPLRFNASMSCLVRTTARLQTLGYDIRTLLGNVTLGLFYNLQRKCRSVLIEQHVDAQRWEDASLDPYLHGDHRSESMPLGASKFERSGEVFKLDLLVSIQDDTLITTLRAIYRKRYVSLLHITVSNNHRHPLDSKIGEPKFLTPSPILQPIFLNIHAYVHNQTNSRLVPTSIHIADESIIYTISTIFDQARVSYFPERQPVEMYEAVWCPEQGDRHHSHRIQALEIIMRWLGALRCKPFRMEVAKALIQDIRRLVYSDDSPVGERDIRLSRRMSSTTRQSNVASALVNQCSLSSEIWLAAMHFDIMCDEPLLLSIDRHNISLEDLYTAATAGSVVFLARGKQRSMLRSFRDHQLRQLRRACDVLPPGSSHPQLIHQCLDKLLQDDDGSRYTYIY